MTKKSKRVIRRKGKNQVSKSPTVGVGPSATSTLLRHIPLFPISTLRRGQLYYDYQLTTTATSGALSVYQFSANGIYDPNITGTGHQVMGFDQMMSLYEHWVVVRSHITVTAFSFTSTTNRHALLLSPDTTTPTIPAVVENGLMVMRASEGKADPGMHNMTTLKLSCDVGRYFGKTQRELQDNPNFQGDASSNPSEQVYYQLILWGGFEAATTTLLFDVLLSYDVFYFEPRKETASYHFVAKNAGQPDEAKK